MAESQTVTAILQYLHAHRIPAWRVNTGAFTAEHKGKTRFHRFGSKGMSDIVGILPQSPGIVSRWPPDTKDGQFLAIEVKSRTGKVTPEQSAFLDDVRTAGGVAFVARSVTDVQKALGL